MPPKRVVKEEQPDDQFKKMNASQLQHILNLSKERVNDLKSKRNYIQMDRDMVQQYYQNTELQIEELKLQILNKQTEAESLQKNHNVEVKVYLQKVKHLQYEQQRANMDIEQDGQGAKQKQMNYFQGRVESMKKVKQEFKKKYYKDQQLYIQNSETTEKQYISKQQYHKKQYNRNLVEIQKKYEDRLVKLKDQLDLKLKVQIHEVQERKNLHINQLMRNHQEAFIQLKAYYNDITSDNLKLIRDHKAEIKKISQQAEANKKLISDLRNGNNQLKKPLENLRNERDKLKTLLKQFEKHKMSLHNYKSKFSNLKQKILVLEKDSIELNQRLTKVQKQKKDLQQKFQKIAEQVKRHADMHNMILNQRLLSMVDQLQQKQGQLHQVIQQAALQPSTVDQLSDKVKTSIETKNTLIKNLKYSIHHATKAYNDAIRVYEAKLVEFGIPAEQLGFQPLETVTSTMPAGLVSS